ncbi:hypothetical protein PQ465_15870 [Sphingobacterium oryzagri]|uniref:DUF1735 domain-containing protein n=1 Tax=Sphingobacterium oryzagri TaxID=3025669 RepID=A0ABY7WGW5_9SPHI|nr:hypothetical protein [Sphingobacterium sp. KACC 22765]WDF67767.1 hypothetical protein PQ465_15870 [Sphingobacterium sp. KACC 22765]
MKKILFAVLLGTASLALTTGCTKEYITNNYLPGVSITTNITAQDWTVERPGLYSVDLDFPELDEIYYQNGSVQVAVQLGGPSGGYDILPATIGDFHYSINYFVGSVQIFAENRSGSTAAPSAMVAKITLTDAENGGN